MSWSVSYLPRNIPMSREMHDWLVNRVGAGGPTMLDPPEEWLWMTHPADGLHVMIFRYPGDRFAFDLAWL